MTAVHVVDEAEMACVGVEAQLGSLNRATVALVADLPSVLGVHCTTASAVPTLATPAPRQTVVKAGPSDEMGEAHDESLKSETMTADVGCASTSRRRDAASARGSGRVQGSLPPKPSAIGHCAEAEAEGGGGGAC